MKRGERVLYNIFNKNNKYYNVMYIKYKYK